MPDLRVHGAGDRALPAGPGADREAQEGVRYRLHALLAARASAEDSSKIQDREIAVVRPGLPTMIFDDDSAIAASLT